MEHILQFGINIDDEAIKKAIEERAGKEVKEELKQSIKDHILHKWGGFTAEANVVIKEVMEGWKDEILELAVADVTNTMKRSKKYREALANIVEDINEVGK